MISNKFLIAVGFSQRTNKLEKTALAKYYNCFFGKSPSISAVVPLAKAIGNDFLPDKIS